MPNKAVTVAYGLLFGTIILLIILPAMFLSFNSLRVRWATVFSSEPVTTENVEPAIRELKSPLV